MRKAMILIAAAISMGSAISFAAANDPKTDAILNHSVVKAVEKLMNDKYAGTCVLPSTDKDVRWFCTGLIPRVTKAQIMPTGCFFTVNVVCSGETAEISGSTTTYYLNTPDGKGQNTVQPFDSGVTITNVDFK